MNSIEKAKNLPSVQFEDIDERMTHFQSSLLNLLVTKLKANEPISKEDIYQWYVDGFIKKNQKLGVQESIYDWDEGKWKWVRTPVDDYIKKYDWVVRRNSFSLFKNVLGACIVKGKLLAIPIIEIDN